MATETAASEQAARERKVDAFVFDCVCHIFNFDPTNAIGPPGQMFDEHLYAFHQLLTPEGETDPAAARSSCASGASTRSTTWSIEELRHRHDRGAAAAADRPVPRRALAVGEVRRAGRASDPDRTVFWGSVNPLEGKKALDLMERQVEELRREGVQVLQRPLRLRAAVPVADGRPAGSRSRSSRRRRSSGVNLIGVHKGVPLGPQPIEHTQTWDMDGAAANFPDINFVIFHVGLPFLDEVLLAAHPLPEPVRVDRGDGELHRPRQPRVFAEIARQAAVLVRRGQDHLRRRGADLAPAVGAARRSGTSSSRRTSSRATATRSSPSRPSGRSSARTSRGCTASTSRPRRPSSACRAERGAKLGGAPSVGVCARVRVRRCRDLQVRRRPWRVGFDERDQARAARALGDREAGVDAAGHGRAGSPPAPKLNRSSTLA